MIKKNINVECNTILTLTIYLAAVDIAKGDGEAMSHDKPLCIYAFLRELGVRSHSLKKVRRRKAACRETSLVKLEIGTPTKYLKNFFPNPQSQLN
ncbi:hypothetical protein [Nostoc sp. 'Lobaria pulmonaria (5183) cyanobiont']|uniref:hypothetical protein n=1 Tax=Nostoc sp. 'Lobaria pulmonaria (5183) cyanobiont' TaxID=1618022 RepID=UPI000CF32CF5|nr:hypothetical protein [Nostoc sp. 'Lobaria pulmonaria (5183) cyanobiont']